MRRAIVPGARDFLITEFAAYMHNCRRTQNALTDLLFDELHADKRARVLAEIETCDECQQHYSSLTETLALFDEAANAALPQSETFWPAYHERLRNSLNEPPAHPLRSERETKRLSFWRRAVSMRVQIPVPVLAAVSFLVVAPFLSLLILRPVVRLNGSLTNKSAETAAAQFVGSNNLPLETPARIVEVPVVQEKIVTRIVYVNRQPQDVRRNATRRRNDQFSVAGSREQMIARAAAQLPPAPFARQSLAGFEPTNEVKLTVIKATEEHK